jgi:hypothetical protein
MLPQAFITHRIAERRLRLKIPAKKGDAAYFDEVRQRLDGFRTFQQLEVKPLTGSILLKDEDLDIIGIAAFASQKGLFQLEDAVVPVKPPVPLAKRVAEPLGQFSAWIRQFTKGDLDLADVLFILLVIFGLVEIARGNFKRPPWYTAFWYAFGILTKSVIDRTTENKAQKE